MRIVRCAVRAGGAVAREREVVHHQGRDDFRALIEHAADDGRVVVGNETLEHVRAAADGNSRDRDAILHSDAFALELARGRALHADFAHHGIERIFLAGGTPARVALAILLDRGTRLDRRLVDAIEERDDRRQHPADRIRLRNRSARNGCSFAMRLRSSFLGASIGMAITSRIPTSSARSPVLSIAGTFFICEALSGRAKFRAKSQPTQESSS